MNAKVPFIISGLFLDHASQNFKSKKSVRKIAKVVKSAKFFKNRLGNEKVSNKDYDCDFMKPQFHSKNGLRGYWKREKGFLRHLNLQVYGFLLFLESKYYFVLFDFTRFYFSNKKLANSTLKQQFLRNFLKTFWRAFMKLIILLLCFENR